MSLKKNVVANYLGQGWSGLIGLALVPVYIKYLGIEAYGLIGIFALLQAWLTLLDMGMTPTLTREMARFTAGAHTPQSIRDLLRSLEIICFGLAALIGLSVWAASGWLAADWLRVDALSLDVVAQAIAIMGGVAALRFVEGIYRGAILGLQRQVFFNVVNASLSTVRAVGAIAVLVWISPTIEAYFVWQAIVSVVSIVILALAAHRSLPPTSRRARFSRQALIDIRNFAAGMMGTTFLAILLTQVDKVLLSKLISLEAFGYYTLAGSIAAALYLLIAPVTQAFYPRFTELVARGEVGDLAKTYHRGSQLVAVLTAPAALALVFFPNNILLLWTGNAVLAQTAAPILAPLALGTMLNAFMQIPYMLQLAHGWTSLAVRINAVAVALLVPAIFWAVGRFGALGAAWVWVLLNAGYVFLGAHFMYMRLLPKEKRAWYRNDIFAPVLTSALIACFFYLVQPSDLGGLSQLIGLFVVAMLMISGALFAAPELRAGIFQYFRSRLKESHRSE